MHFTYFFLFFSLTCTCCVKETWSTHTKTPFWDTHTNYPCGPHHRPWDDCKTTTTTTTTTNKQTTTTTTTTTNSKLLSTLITKSSPSYFPTTAHDTTAHSTTAHSTTAASFKSTSKVNYPSSSLVPSTTTSDFHQQEVATG